MKCPSQQECSVTGTRFGHDKAAAETALAHPSLLCITGPSLLWFGSLVPQSPRKVAGGQL